MRTSKATSKITSKILENLKKEAETQLPIITELVLKDDSGNEIFVFPIDSLRPGFVLTFEWEYEVELYEK